MPNEENKRQREPYEKPTATKLTPEQAKVKLMDHATVGDEQAKELFDTLFQQAHQQSQKQSHGRPAATFHLHFSPNDGRQENDDAEHKESD